VVSALAARAGSPATFDVLLLSSQPGGDAPERGTNLVAESSVPPALREAVASSQRQSWTYTEIQFLDGRSTPGLVVGAPLFVPTVGSYELYYLFPLSQEQGTLDLVRSSVLLIGLVLVLLLAGIAWLVTRQVVVPVRAASQTAARLAEGNLAERMKVSGTDDLASLATSFNAMAVSLARQIRQLEDLSRVQQRFVSDVSHELRTPLTTIRMAADVVYEDREQLDPPTARAVELLQNQLDRFEALLADLLEISRFDAGAAVLDAERIDLVALTGRAIDAARPLAERQGLDVRLVTTETICPVECDPRRVDRILRNLLENAIEHGDLRGVDVHVAQNDEAVAVAVRDFGAGLRPGESALVFNRFWRADPARARTMGGTGLGLAISLEDARLHGGWLEAWGEPGKGACFRLTLPKDRAVGFTDSPLPLEPAEVGAEVVPVDGSADPVEARSDDPVVGQPAAASPAAKFVIGSGDRG
jgi:two-component system sensor histidine kinase MtrB